MIANKFVLSYDFLYYCDYCDKQIEMGQTFYDIVRDGGNTQACEACFNRFHSGLKRMAIADIKTR
jgi:hypothetical protein